MAPLAVLGALGTVYGDIGTSPLYAFEEAVAAAGGPTPAAVLGVLSLIFWALLLVISVKYVLLILRADNSGEGGILAMLALLQRGARIGPRWAGRAVVLAAFGAALFYCDALITPAISILGAVEGLELLGDGFRGMAVPVTLGILIPLFAIQRKGTERIGRVFGWVMVMWFAAISATGALGIAGAPQVLAAVDPRQAFHLIASAPGLALLILAAVFLVLTGGEALYADMGHFGRRPVQVAWFVAVWPALLLNYFGQGALVLRDPEVASHAFYALTPQPLLPLMVMLATAASTITAQAVITGAFSVTRQAIQLDLLPRLRILQTSEHAHGQIYVPAANVAMFLCVALFVVGFGSSSSLSAAYGTSVVGTMLITTVLGAAVALRVWRWRPWRVVAIFGGFLALDAVFAIANATKVRHGGWITLLLALLLLAAFLTWHGGRIRLRRRLREIAVPLDRLPGVLDGATRVRGTGVFLVSDAGFVPTALVRNVEHNHVVHEHIVILHFLFTSEPREDPLTRSSAEEILPDVHVVTARFGFMETPSLSAALKTARLHGLHVDFTEASYFLGWHIVRPRSTEGWSGLHRRIFAAMQRHSAQAAQFFRMPERRVVVLGTEVDI